MEKTINQKELGSSANGAGASQTLSDEDIGDILARLHKVDFASMSTKDMSVHARVMVALLAKIAKRHSELVKLRDEVETRTQNVAQREEAASLAAMLSQLHKEMGVVTPTRRRLRTWLTLGILPTPR